MSTDTFYHSTKNIFVKNLTFFLQMKIIFSHLIVLYLRPRTCSRTFLLWVLIQHLFIFKYHETHIYWQAILCPSLHSGSIGLSRYACHFSPASFPPFLYSFPFPLFLLSLSWFFWVCGTTEKHKFPVGTTFSEFFFKVPLCLGL